jgi:uncharacterized phage protein (TIGR01671 family)
MREIKFRAWDGKVMHYDVVPWRWDFVISLGWHRCERSTGSGILGSGGKEGDFLVPGIAFKKLMQFTGLKDKNGKEVFEGDIVSGTVSMMVGYDIHTGGEEMSDEPFKSHVEWRDGAMEINIQPYDSWLSLGEVKAQEIEYEIIGNLYENPELING